MRDKKMNNKTRIAIIDRDFCLTLSDAIQRLSLLKARQASNNGMSTMTTNEKFQDVYQDLDTLEYQDIINDSYCDYLKNHDKNQLLIKNNQIEICYKLHGERK